MYPSPECIRLYQEAVTLCPNFRIETREFPKGFGFAWFANIEGDPRGGLYGDYVAAQTPQDVQVFLFVAVENLRRICARLGYPKG